MGKTGLEQAKKRSRGEYKGTVDIKVGENNPELIQLATVLMREQFSYDALATLRIQHLVAAILTGIGKGDESLSAVGHEYPDENWAVARWLTDYLVNPGGEDQKERIAQIKEITKKNIAQFFSIDGKQHANHIGAEHIVTTITKIFFGSEDLLSVEERDIVFNKLLGQALILAAPTLVTNPEKKPRMIAPFFQALDDLVVGKIENKMKQLQQIIKDALERSPKASFIENKVKSLFEALRNGETAINGVQIPDYVIGRFKRTMSKNEGDSVFTEKNVFLTQILTVMSAGTETTASMVSGITIGLGADLDLQEELIKAHLENDKSTYNQLKRTFIRDVLHRHAPADIRRVITQDIEVEGIMFQPGDTITIDPRVMRHYKGKKQPKLTPFGQKDNPRFCVGRPLAELEMSIYFDELIDYLAMNNRQINYLHKPQEVGKSKGLAIRKPANDTIKVISLK